jgi:transcriptional regulator with XRE-family HTH domain
MQKVKLEGEIMKKKLTAFGKEVEKLLLEAEATRDDLAVELMINISQVNGWLNGTRKAKPENKDRILEAIKKIAAKKGKDLSALIILGSDNIGNIKGSNNIVAGHNIDCREALDLAKKYIKKLEEENEKLKEEIVALKKKNNGMDL